ncbi:hypothetical protein CSB37_03350 [bacterium DOLZORAL124_38_8]|nr:MAG: hypothetical protein CSB37_03350 [bacterium DOLZORAL124_38_8]
MIERICRVSGEKFEITKEDLEFYMKMDVVTKEQLETLTSLQVGRSASINEADIPAELLVGLPTLCPTERQRRRLASINQRVLHKNSCSETHKSLISNYSPESGIPVVSISHWYSDDFDGLKTGRSFDFSRPFFEQFSALNKVSARPNLMNTPSFDENSAYTHHCGKSKNCYLLVDSDFNRDCAYSTSLNNCENVYDSFRVDKSELGYENIDCQNCYDSKFLQNSQNCSNSWFLKNCIGCNNCFGCVNLRNKEYYFLNQKCSPAEYQQKIDLLLLTRHSSVAGLREKFQDYCQQFPYKFMEGRQNEGVLGNYLTNCKNALYCYDSRNQHDCKYVYQGFETARDVQDCMEIGVNAELLYECSTCGYDVQNLRFSLYCFEQSSKLDYCNYCWSCKDCFGCVGLRKKQYCILNKQYTQEEYEMLVPQIIEHMKKTGEWGEYFPVNISSFAYNESVANEYFPLTKEMAVAQNYQWKEDVVTTKYKGEMYQIPDDIADVSDEIVTKILQCERSGKLYKIQKAELRFYRKMNLPIPRLHPDERHKDRMALRNPRALWKRTCGDCGCEIQTTFAPDRPEKILCESCYLQVVD